MAIAAEAAAPGRWRLFLAVEVPEAVRGALDEAVAPLRTAWPDLRWTHPEGWHLTVAFLGGVDVAVVPAIGEAVELVTARIAPFDVALREEAGRTRSGVLWVEADGSRAFAELAGAVRSVLAHLGLRTDERPFRAHLTLARAPGRAAIPRAAVAAYAPPSHRAAGRWRADGLVLVRSHLGRGGSRYERIASYPFRAG